MAIPEQIRKQTEAVQELYKQLNAADNAGGDDTAPTGGAPASESYADSQSADSSAPSAAAPPPADEHRSGGDSVPEETVLQKYKTLQGMYNAEVPRLHQQNREMVQRLQQMEQLIASMSAQPAATAPQQPTADKFVTEKDVEEYGDSIDMMRRVAREEASSVASRLKAMEQLLQQMQSSVVPQVQAVAQRQQVSAEQQFWAELGTQVPNYRTINNQEDFRAWLLEIDPLTGISRQTYLDDAQRSMDSNRVANFFRTWLERTGQATVAQTSSRASSELEKQVAPGRSRGAGAPAANSKAKLYTPADIQTFFNDVRMGKFKGREQERDRIERDIFAAQRENRIQAIA